MVFKKYYGIYKENIEGYLSLLLHVSSYLFITVITSPFINYHMQHLFSKISKDKFYRSLT